MQLSLAMVQSSNLPPEVKSYVDTAVMSSSGRAEYNQMVAERANSDASATERSFISDQNKLKIFIF
jgi:hypothetical protein